MGLVGARWSPEATIFDTKRDPRKIFDISLSTPGTAGSSPPPHTLGGWDQLGVGGHLRPRASTLRGISRVKNSKIFLDPGASAQDLENFEFFRNLSKSPGSHSTMEMIIF